MKQDWIAILVFLGTLAFYGLFMLGYASLFRSLEAKVRVPKPKTLPFEPYTASDEGTPVEIGDDVIGWTTNSGQPRDMLTGDFSWPEKANRFPR